jgi:hypothetical protein
MKKPLYGGPHCRRLEAIPHRAAGSLFDHLVGGGEQRFRDGEAECFGGLEVDDALEFRGLLDRQIARRRFTLQNPSGVSTTESACKIAAWSVKTGYETVLYRIAAVPKHDRDRGGGAPGSTGRG